MPQEQNRASRIAPDARTIEETQVIRLSVADQHAFADAMINPPRPGPALLRAAEAHRSLITGSE
jgi:uncharacterized protein (DUF1778 family)